MENNDNDIELTIDLHYVMDLEKLHRMDADIHNKCNACIIDVINHLGDVFDDDYQLDFSASPEGGVRDIFKLIIKSQVGHDVFIGVVSALISHFISVAPSIDESQRQLNRIELIERLKKGQYTDEELEFILTGDPKYMENRNKFYKNLDNAPHVKCVKCKATGGSLPDDGPEAIIDKKDFRSQIISRQTNTRSETFTNTSVMVLIPVLSISSKAKWKGLFNDQEIPFTIKDKSFRDEVFNKEVHFVAGTSLRCDFTITTETKYDKNGLVEKNSKTGVVKNVMSCYDGDVLAFHSKRYKKIKAKENERSLFSNEDFKE